jgi:hypothetical protein
VVNPVLSPVEEKLGLNRRALKAGGFVIWTGRVKNHPAVVVAGQDGISTLYGVYDLVERLGVTFRLTGGGWHSDTAPQNGDYGGGCFWTEKGDGSRTAIWRNDDPMLGTYKISVYYGRPAVGNLAASI